MVVIVVAWRVSSALFRRYGLDYPRSLGGRRWIDQTAMERQQEEKLEAGDALDVGYHKR